MTSLNGVYTALITPFDSEGRLDEEGLSYLIHRQLESQIDGIVPLGTTGESPTLTQNERERIIRVARDETPSTTVLMIGTGSNSTAQTIESTVKAERLGADMALVVIPYYNKPTQEGLYLHFKAITKETTLPIIIYNPPHRTGQNLQIETFRRLLDIPSIIGIKESTGNISLLSEVIEDVLHHRPDFNVLTGDDAFLLPAMALGAKGVISVVANLVPEKMKELYLAIANEDFGLARELHYQLIPLFRAVFIETNPIPIKAAMNYCHLPAGSCRLPLCDLSQNNATTLYDVVTEFSTAFFPT